MQMLNMSLLLFSLSFYCRLIRCRRDLVYVFVCGIHVSVVCIHLFIYSSMLFIYVVTSMSIRST
jgi:hypothetical protein